MVDFTRDDQVRVHPHGAIRQICAMFRSHEDGLPEWIKNSSDAYTRLDVQPELSAVVVMLTDGRGATPSIVGCLDFGGMTVADIEGRFRHWADPEAAGDEEGIQGGHGNGGKCYMTQLFADRSYIQTLRDGRANHYGFVGGDPTPGYFPDLKRGRDVPVRDADAELERSLAPFGVTIAGLPAPAQKAWAARKAFTLVAGVGAKNLARIRIPATAWINSLAGHTQMVHPLRRAQVFVIHNASVHPDAAPLTLPEIEPIPGAEAARVIAVPETLIDPQSGQEVETGASEKSRLELRTSSKSMRWEKRLARHTVAGWTTGGQSTGFWEVISLSSAAYANKIYGDVYLDALADYRQNDRRNHSEGPLTRALRAWITEQIELYSAEFVEIDRLQASAQQRNELSRLNEALNSWKNAFLQEEFGGLGDGSPGVIDFPPQPPRPPLPHGTVAHVVVGIANNRAGLGVSFRPTVEFFDAAGLRVRPVPHEWRISNPEVLRFDPELNMLTTIGHGITEVAVECKDTGVSSNPVTLEVLDIADVQLAPSDLTLAARTRTRITALVTTVDGETFDDVFLVWTEDDRSIVSVGATGMVYGLVPGRTAVTAGDDAATAQPASVEVTPPSEVGDKGSGFPQILLSEIDSDPFGEGPPVFSSAEPPVYQRPQDVDANIWWINMASPLARRYIDPNRGGGPETREWRAYLLERYIEVMVKIILTYDFTHGEQLSFETMLRRWEEESVNMQQRAVDTLASYLDGGEVEIRAAAA